MDTLGEKLPILRGIYDIVDVKYGVEKDLRTVQSVYSWIKSEVTEVLEARRSGDEYETRSEICDFLYVTYAHMKWRTGRTQEEILQIFSSHPSFHHYMNELSTEDLKESREKFRQRNIYLYDTDFIAHLENVPTVAGKLTEIDKYWDIIKYRDQKGFNSPAFQHYNKASANPEAFPDEVVEAQRVLYGSRKGIDGIIYLSKVLDGSGIPEPYLTHLKRLFAHNPDTIQAYVDACEVFISKGHTPIEALICASLQSRFTPHRVYFINQTILLLEHGKGWERHLAAFMASSDSYEAYLFVDALLQEGYGAGAAIEFVFQSTLPWTPNRDGFCRVLRSYVDKGMNRYKKAHSAGKSPGDIIKDVWSEANSTFREDIKT